MIVSSDSTEDEEFDIETQRKKRPLKRRKMRDGNTAVVQVTTDPDVDNFFFRLLMLKSPRCCFCHIISYHDRCTLLK
jgi:hypothetical protein